MQPAHLFGIPAHHRFRRHEHPGPHLCAVVGGSFLERSGRTWTRVEPGSVRVSGGARHDIDFGPAGATCLLLDPGDMALPRLSAPRFLGPDPWLSDLVARFGAALSRPSASEPTGIVGLASELWAQVLRRIEGRVTPAPAWLRRVPDMVNDAPSRLAVSTLAAELGVHRVHLARVFRDHYGLSVTAYVQKVRLERVRQMLTGSRTPLAEVAMAAGFSDQSHMTRAVRAAFGVTPGAMRDALHPFKNRPGHVV